MIGRAPLIGVLAALTMFVPSLAFGQDDDARALPSLPEAKAEAPPAVGSSSDVVQLRNGGLYRGRVTEIVPGDHVTVHVEMGERKTVPWSEIDRVVVGAKGGAASGASTPGASAPTPPPPVPTPMVGPRVRVHLKSSKPLILYRKPAGSSAWVYACTTPCNEDLPLGDTYRATGSGQGTSKEFQLNGEAGSAVELEIDPPSKAGMTLAGIAAGLGGTLLYVGLLTRSSNDCFDCTQDSNKNTGTIVMLVGAGAIVAGTIGFILSARTDVSVARRSEAAVTKPPRPLTSFLRAPTWKERSVSDAAAMAAPTSFPLVFQGTF